LPNTLPACADDFQNPKAIIPPSPSRTASPEANPFRRSRCRPRRCAAPSAKRPRPPALVGKINLNIIDGKTVSAYPSVTLDIENLMTWTNNQLKLNTATSKPTSQIFLLPTELPVLYITGWTPLPTLSDKTKQSLREYLLGGGTLIVHANCAGRNSTPVSKNSRASFFPTAPWAGCAGPPDFIPACTASTP